MPEKLPKGPFKIHAFYRKYKKDKHFDSPLSNELILYNTNNDPPSLIKIEILKIILESKDELPYKVTLYFNSGDFTDITEYADVDFTNEEIISLNKNKITPLKNGRTKLKANFIWKPSNQIFEDEITIFVQFPEKPDFHEVIINEIFPYATYSIPETDANMDGFAKSFEDEFIELKNKTNKKINLADCSLYINEETKPSYKFTENTIIDPNSLLVIFGNQTNKLDLSNSGGVIELLCNKKTIDYIFCEILCSKTNS